MNDEIRYAMNKIVNLILCIFTFFIVMVYHFFYYGGELPIIFNMVCYSSISFIVGGFIYEMYLYVERIYLILKLQELEKEKEKRLNEQEN